MSPLFIVGAVIAGIFTILLVLHIFTWIKGNGQKASWHLGRLLVDFVFLAAAGALIFLGV